MIWHKHSHSDEVIHIPKNCTKLQHSMMLEIFPNRPLVSSILQNCHFLGVGSWETGPPLLAFNLYCDTIVVQLIVAMAKDRSISVIFPAFFPAPCGSFSSGPDLTLVRASERCTRWYGAARE